MNKYWLECPKRDAFNPNQHKLLDPDQFVVVAQRVV